MATPAAKLGICIGTATVIAGGATMTIYINKTFNSKNNIEFERSNFGENYSSLLVDPDISKTKSWWEDTYKSFLNKEKQKLSKPFKSINKAWSSVEKDNTSLNQVCKTIYNTKVDPFYQTTSPDFLDIDTFNSNFWEFCTQVKNKPLTLFEAYEYNQDPDQETINGLFQYADYLVAIYPDKNNLFWKIKDAIYLNSSKTIDPSFEAFAKSLGEKALNEEGKVSLKKVCFNIYPLELKKLKDLKPDTIQKYCGFLN